MARLGEFPGELRGEGMTRRGESKHPFPGEISAEARRLAAYRATLRGVL